MPVPVSASLSRESQSVKTDMFTPNCFNRNTRSSSDRSSLFLMNNTFIIFSLCYLLCYKKPDKDTIKSDYRAPASLLYSTRTAEEFYSKQAHSPQQFAKFTARV